MPRKFTTADDLLHDLLNRYEAGTGEPVGYPDHTGFGSVLAADQFMRRVSDAEQFGAVSLTRNSGRRQGELKFVRLADPNSLYRYLQRIPSSQAASAAGETILNGLTVDPAIRNLALTAIDAWSRNKKWSFLGIENAPSMRNAVVLAQAIVDRKHAGLDYRTFSRRTVGDSKELERIEGAVLRLVGTVIDLPPSRNARASFASLGLERFSQPLLLSGRFLLSGANTSAIPYVGIPPASIETVSFPEPPEYVLTIENFASFNRHVLEADTGRRGLTLYVGGYPSLAAQKALRLLSSRLPPEVRFFHWSDIDPDGTWIFRTIEAAVERTLRPHLMTRELAEAFGEPLAGQVRLRKGEGGDSMIAGLMDYLSSAEAKTMEQEHIDPSIPDPHQEDLT